MKRFLSLFLLLTATMMASAQQPVEDLDAKYGAQLLKPGTPAPDCTLRSYAPYNQTDISLRELTEGGYAVLDFWASWCGDCRRDMPAVAAMSNKYFMKGVTFVGISYDTDSVAWRKCCEKDYKLNGAQLSELKKWKETQTSKDYHISWLPTLYLLNPDGTVNLATVDRTKLERRLEELDAAGAFEKYKLVMPEFPGGVQRLIAYMTKNLKYPKVCEKAGAQAKMIVHFAVNKEGALEDIRVVNYKQLGRFSPRKAVQSANELPELGQQCQRLFEAEALRVVKQMPHWTPGYRADKKVKVMYHLPVTFRQD